MQITFRRAVRALSATAVVIATAVLPLSAVETKFWQQDNLSDLEKGNLNKISIRSDGRLSLAPVVTELLDSSTPYLWAVAQDSKGNVYAGGGGPSGSTAKLFRIDPAGKSTVVAELNGLEIHAIAVDARDRVYAATAPDSKVYRIVNGKPELFFDPQAKYIWAMAFSHKGDLYLVTGDRGEVFKVGPDGKGSVFFKTEETHARSLAIDSIDNIIVGTEPSGIVLKISPSGDGFVLYQTPKREVTAVAVGKDGSVYAAAVGNKSGLVPSLSAPPLPPPSPAPTSGAGGPVPVAVQSRSQAPAPPPSFSSSGSSVSGGSEVYRIGVDGAPRKIWSHAQDIAYALVVDDNARATIGTGNKGNIYRLDSDFTYTLLVNLAPTQVTGFARGVKGELLAATGNIGKLYRIRPQLEKTGTYESDALDAEAFTYWGRLSWSGSASGGGVAFDARSGNVNNPQKNWSPWSPVPMTGDGGKIAAPAARFLQYRATLTAGANGTSPEISAIEIAHMAKNIAPSVREIEATPANYRFPAPSALTSTTTASITLPAIGSHKKSATASLDSSSSGTSMQYAKGQTGARWLASDENGDTLMFKVEIRGVQETAWKLLKDKLKERQLSWDSTAFPDGKYVLRVTASDAPSNPPAEAMTASMISDPFLIDNTPPQIVGLTATPSGSSIEVRWRGKDALSVIDKAEYSVNGGDWTIAEPVGRLSDSPELEYRIQVNRPQPGEYTIAVRVTDEYDNQSVEKVVVK